MQTPYIFMFFEPPYLWHRLWCVGLIAGFSQITGEGMETSFPARRLLSALQRKTGRGRIALFLSAVIARWIFPAGIFCWENARIIKNCGKCRERNGIV